MPGNSHNHSYQYERYEEDDDDFVHTTATTTTTTTTNHIDDHIQNQQRLLTDMKHCSNVVDQDDIDENNVDDVENNDDDDDEVVVNENDFVVESTTTPNENDEYSAASSINAKILDGEKMLEVTRKLFRSTERDPDRDLRKQVLLKTALRNLPHFVHYQQYREINNQQQQQHLYNNNNINTINDNNNSVQQQYNNHLQPNAIEVSTTSMRMLDLNDDYDQRDDLERLVGKTRQQQQSGNNNNLQTSHLDEQHNDDNEISSHFEQNNTANQFDDILFNRHNSFDNLYQPNELNESNEEEATINHINWNNIGYKIFEFPSIDTVSKVSNFLEEEFQVAAEAPQHSQEEEQDKIDEDESLSNEPTLNQHGTTITVKDTTTSPSSSCTDESLNLSDTSNGEDVDDKEENSSNKHDSGNTLTNSFYPVSSSPRSYKRRSSRDYEDSMDIDLARASKLFETSPFGQFKRLRKNFETQSAPLIETTTGGF